MVLRKAVLVVMFVMYPALVRACFGAVTLYPEPIYGVEYSPHYIGPMKHMHPPPLISYRELCGVIGDFVVLYRQFPYSCVPNSTSYVV